MGPGLVYLDKPNKTKKSTDGETASLYYGSCSMQGWRINMEDAHLAVIGFGGDPSACLFAIFDGHGGREVAEYARRHLPDELLRNPNYPAGNYEKALSETFLKLDSSLDTEAGKKEVIEIGKEAPSDGTPPESPSKKNLFLVAEEGPEMKGCTANVMLIKNKIIYVANIGDSRAILSVKGVVTELSKDHKPDNDGEKARIIRAGGTFLLKQR